MKIIGLTGGIGSGKTTVCKVFEKLGIPVYYADIQAKLLMTSNFEIKNQLIKRFGVQTYINNELNRKYIAEQIFNNKENLNFINSIVHPVVRNHFAEWIQKQNSPYIINENAILFESGFYKDTNIIVSVITPENIRIKRVIERDNTTTEAVKSRINNQISDKEIINQSDYIIYNDSTNLILPQILQIHRNILKTLATQ